MAVRKAKYEATLRNGKRGHINVYGDSIVDVRKKLMTEFRKGSWDYTTESVGFLYSLDVSGRVKDQLGYFTTDSGLRWVVFKPNGKFDRYIVKADGTLGMTMISYHNMKNKILGLK